MKILVIGGTGNVGSQVVQELSKRGAGVRILTRDPFKVKDTRPGVEVVKGDLLDPATVRSVFHGVDGAFVISPVSPTETQEGLMAVSGAIQAKLPRIVHLSVQHADRAMYLPHFGAKVAVELAVRDSGIPWTILRPSNFFQNDYYFRDALLQYGVYPQPFGDTGVSRVDTRDIAELAAIALTQPGHESKRYDVVGPRAIGATETAKIWGEKLGKPIRYAGNDLDAWEKQSLAWMPPYLAYDFRLMYAHFQKHGLIATADEVATLTQALGHAPRSFEAFAEETAKQWAAEPAATR